MDCISPATKVQLEDVVARMRLEFKIRQNVISQVAIKGKRTTCTLNGDCT